MKAIDIIDALTRVGVTENMGVIESPEKATEVQDWLQTWFGGDSDIECAGTIITNRKYLYSYSERLWSLKGTAKEDFIVKLNDGTSSCEIFLYVIE